MEAVYGIKLVEYSKQLLRCIYCIKCKSIDKLPTDKQTLYIALPDTFTTSEGVQVAESMGMAERTFKRFLSNRELFNNYTRGEYEKRY